MQITRLGVLWDEAALAGLLKTKVPVCYGGESVLLNRARVAYGVAYWHGVAFTASRRGLIAFMFDQEWRARYARACLRVDFEALPDSTFHALL